MSAFDPVGSAATSSAPPQGYWDGAEQAARSEKFAEAPLRPGTEETRIDAALPRNAADTAIPVSGNDRGTPLPSKQTPDGKPILVTSLHRGEQAEVTRERTNAGGYVSSDQVVFTTGEGDDHIQISQRDDGTLDVDVNGEQYAVRLNSQQELTLRTGGGNDTITAAPNVTVNLVVDSGDGDDTVTTGMGDDRIFTGEGNDTVTTIGGRNDIDGGRGDDVINATGGQNIIFGGDGNDEITADAGFNFIEGGRGDDTVTTGAGHNIVSGGRGDDTINADPSGRNYIYAGLGGDTVNGAGAGSTVYAEAGDVINAATGARPTVVNVEIDQRAGHSVTVNGSDQFRDRVEAELDFLRASPNFTRMLSEFDGAAETKGNRVTIQELANEQNGYAQTFSRDADIVNGRPGAGGDVTISYNPSFHMDAFPAPTGVLYHEMSHAYNGVNGTFLPGTYVGELPDSGRVPNAERQAVGLESSAEPYDFDGTGPITHNPIHLTENGWRREVGLPDRPSYAL